MKLVKAKLILTEEGYERARKYCGNTVKKKVKPNHYMRNCIVADALAEQFGMVEVVVISSYYPYGYGANMPCVEMSYDLNYAITLFDRGLKPRLGAYEIDVPEEFSRK